MGIIPDATLTLVWLHLDVPNRPQDFRSYHLFWAFAVDCQKLFDPEHNDLGWTNLPFI